MEILRQQAIAIINVCKTALAKGKGQQGVDDQTVAVAQAILTQAKAALPEDKILASISLEPPISFWTTIQTAMELVEKSLPNEASISLVEGMKKAQKRVAVLEEPLNNAVAEYVSALKEYEQPAGASNYSTLEIAKLKIADAVLGRRGIPTNPPTTAERTR